MLLRWNVEVMDAVALVADERGVTDAHGEELSSACAPGGLRGMASTRATPPRCEHPPSARPAAAYL